MPDLEDEGDITALAFPHLQFSIWVSPRWKTGDEEKLFKIYYSVIHQISWIMFLHSLIGEAMRSSSSLIGPSTLDGEYSNSSGRSLERMVLRSSGGDTMGK